MSLLLESCMVRITRVLDLVPARYVFWTEDESSVVASRVDLCNISPRRSIHY